MAPNEAIHMARALPLLLQCEQGLKDGNDLSELLGKKRYC